MRNRRLDLLPLTAACAALSLATPAAAKQPLRTYAATDVTTDTELHPGVVDNLTFTWHNKLKSPLRLRGYKPAYRSATESDLTVTATHTGKDGKHAVTVRAADAAGVEQVVFTMLSTSTDAMFWDLETGAAYLSERLRTVEKLRETAWIADAVAVEPQVVVWSKAPPLVCSGGDYAEAGPTEVVLDLIVDAEGKPVDVAAVEGSIDLFGCATSSTGAWRAEPFLLEGEAVPFRVRVPMPVMVTIPTTFFP